MNLSTKVNIPKYPRLIDPSEQILSIGSCFSEHIGSKLIRSKFNILNNPYGVIFNPSSIHSILRRVIEDVKIEESELNERCGIYSHFDFHSRYNGVDPDEMVQRINQDIDLVRTKIHKVDWLIITLGTSIVYELISDQHIVSNCHKFPSELFQKKMLTTEETTDQLGKLIEAFRKLNDTKVILTVSPIRHIKDGLIENNRSKSRLIEACHLLSATDDVFYFPSYELMIDELRDYRYYERDMIHPSDLAVEMIMERFSERFLSSDAQELISDISKLNQSLLHRPLLPQSEGHQLFLKDLLKKIALLKEKYPHLSFEDEKDQINGLIVI